MLKQEYKVDNPRIRATHLELQEEASFVNYYVNHIRCLPRRLISTRLFSSEILLHKYGTSNSEGAAWS